MVEEKKKGKGTTIALIVIAIIILLFIVLATWQVPYVIKENYDEQVPYTTQERYTEQVPYQTQESYYETVNSDNCDYVADCDCLHKSWAGLGACDSCHCLKYRTVTEYRTETKYRDATAYRTETKQKDVTQYCSALSKIVGSC